MGAFKSPGKSFPAWVRFSSGSGSTRKRDIASKDPDMRGIAVKVLGISGPSALNPADTTAVQDFLFTNRPVPFVRDAQEQLHLFKSSSGEGIEKLSFIAAHPFRLPAILRDTKRDVKSLWTETYWSRLPFLMDEASLHLNETDHEARKNAAKFVIYPCDTAPGDSPLLRPEDVKTKSSNYLADEFYRQAKTRDHCLEIGAQFRDPNDPENLTPIEDVSVEWKTPVIPLARLHIPQRQLKNLSAAVAAQKKYRANEKVDDFCEHLAYNPWNALAAHAPLGAMNRARLEIMNRSQENRSLAGGYTPVTTPPLDSFRYVKTK